MKLSPRITDALPLLKFIAVAAVVLAGVFWFNGLLSAKQELRIRDAQENAINFTTAQFEKVIEADRAKAATIRAEQDAQIAALATRLSAIDARTRQQVGKAREVIAKNPAYQEKLDPEGTALWQEARDRITRKGAPQ